MRQARDLGFQGQIAGLAPLENVDVIAAAGPAAEGTLYAAHFDPDDAGPAVAQFQQKYFKKYRHRAEQFAAVSYEGLHIYADVFQRCPFDTKCARQTLDTSTFPGIISGISFNSYGDPIRDVVIRQIRDGKFQTVR